MQVVWTDPALERVDEIAGYIAQDDPDAAARWAVELFDAVERLTQFPESGRVVPEFGCERCVTHCLENRSVHNCTVVYNNC